MTKNLETIDIKKALKALNKEMKAKKVHDVIYTLGGAALYLMGFDERTTTDVDDLLSRFFVNQTFDAIV